MSWRDIFCRTHRTVISIKWFISKLIACLHNSFFFIPQSLPTCNINLSSIQSLPKFCTWNSWCKDSDPSSDGDLSATGNYNSTNDPSTTQSTINLIRIPPKLPKHHRKMPFRRKNWCGCIQVSVTLELCSSRCRRPINRHRQQQLTMKIKKKN